MNEPTTTKKLYKFTRPYPGEENARFIILENRGDRVLVQEVSTCANMPIAPTFVYQTSELTIE